MGKNGRIENSKDALLDELVEFLSMPSVSAQTDDVGSFQECAEWVRGKLEEAGAEARLVETDGHPVVYAEIGSGDKTRSEEHTSELQSRQYLVCRLLLEKKK